MVSCAIPSCNNSSSEIYKVEDGITFHRFPKNKELRKQWELVVDIEDKWVATSTSVICSKHFEEFHYFVTEKGIRKLTSHALPTLHLFEGEVKEDDSQEELPVVLDPSDSDRVKKLKLEIVRLESLADSRRKNIDVLSNTNRKMQLKMYRYLGMIDDFRKAAHNNTQN